jgi:flagellar biosynthesis component FlhA
VELPVGIAGAAASILITGINILAGFLIGVLQHGRELRRALETYTVLTIGDGLVTVIPALMISISGGLMVTRAGGGVPTAAAADNRTLIEDLAPKLLLLSAVQRVLQNLSRERVSIRDSGSILEALGEAANVAKNLVLITGLVRPCIRRMADRPYLSRAGEICAYLLDPALEQAVESGVDHTEHSSRLNLPPQRWRENLDRMTASTSAPGASKTPFHTPWWVG